LDLLRAAIGVVLGDPQGAPVGGLELAQALLVVVAELDQIINVFSRAIDLGELARFVVAQLGGALDGAKAAVGLGAIKIMPALICCQLRPNRFRHYTLDQPARPVA
jgi:hypothetical protein